MDLSLPLYNPHAGKLGRLLESLALRDAAAVGKEAAAARGMPSEESRSRPPHTPQPLPMTMDEARRRGWDELDVVFITGDAYVDHPSFAMAILGRVLEAAGFRVGIVSQPDWRKVDDWRRFGRPRLFFAISAGNMDSMINHYTANKKVRNADAYSPGGRIGLRPDRATLAYCQRARQAYPGVPIIAGGVEASLRRLAHYDYWSDTVRRSILLDCKADLVVYGMGEEAILEIARRLAAGEKVKDLRDMRGVAYALGAKEPLPPWPPRKESPAATGANSKARDTDPSSAAASRPCPSEPDNQTLILPSYEEVRADKRAFAIATRMIHNETNPYNARRLVQFHERQAVVVNPPRFPLSQASMDVIYGLPYTRRPHPAYREPIPAYEMIKDSVTIMRGCFGGCTFCSITTHQGRIIQSRSQTSILQEIQSLAADTQFKGVVSDIGGPTANMYQMRCTRPEVEAVCRRQSCVHPTICKLLGTDHGPLVALMRSARSVPGVRKVLVASGIRMDLARRDRAYLRELVRHHVGGHLKVAPEHVDPHVLMKMRKPANDDFERFAEAFRRESQSAGKRQYLVPYFIASHPGSDLDAMIRLAEFLKKNGYRPDQVQDFIPAPMDVATAMYYTGLDPFTMERVYVARQLRDRKLQRALLQFFKPENYFLVREALRQAGRTDLIGEGCHCLIPSRPPREALLARRRAAQAHFAGGYVHDPSARQSEAAAPVLDRRPTPSRGRAKRSPATPPSPVTSSAPDERPAAEVPLPRPARQSRRAPGRGYRPGRK